MADSQYPYTPEAAYAEAQRRIAVAAESKEPWRRLSLSALGLETLPPELGQLTGLTELDLSRNQLTSVPPQFSQLTSLTILNLSRNQLSSLPRKIGQLAALRQLYLHVNELSSLPPQISRLTGLTKLGLGGNRLCSIPPEIGQLTALTALFLDNNQIATVPSGLGQLIVLTTLRLEFNQLASLPPELGQLTHLERLYLHGNPLLGLPPEILGPTLHEVSLANATPARPADILAFYFRTRTAASRRPLNEVKVILVGQGSVGKTSLVNRILHNTFDKDERKTEGISISKDWSVPGKGVKADAVQVNLWDFGGQEIMHATHQFFLTKRTIYLLVLDARKGENESNIHYWLKIVRSYGGDSPVLVVTNKCDAHHLDLNETRLRKDYPSIAGFLKTSCETGQGIDALKQAIAAQVHSPDMAHVFDPLPAEYFAVKKQLEAVAAKENYIDIRRYYALCHNNGVKERDDQDRLLRFLHDLGSVLSFTDPDSPLALKEMSVLNPDWVTEGVYKILNDKQLPTSGGLLGSADLPRILDTPAHPGVCHPFIIGMMHKFELCFTIAEGREWLVAELLPVNEPEKLADWDDALRFQYHYQVLPGGIICRFIVRRYANLTAPPIYWRSGVVLRHEGCKALVRSDSDNGRMYIAVTGPENCRRAFLSILRDEFARIHATIPNLRPEQLVPLPDNPGITVAYEHLLTLEQEGINDFIPSGTKKRYAVSALLDGLENPWLRDFGESHLYPPLFVVAPQTSFANAWEVFCCDVLNRHERTTDIYQRKPPERGVDLYWPARQTAYQCKSVDSKTGKFSVNKAIKSLRTALKTRQTLPWTKYVICTNVPLTGPQEDQLRAVHPETEFLTPSFWLPRCREQSQHLDGRFRRLSPMDPRRGASPI